MRYIPEFEPSLLAVTTESEACQADYVHHQLGAETVASALEEKEIEESFYADLSVAEKFLVATEDEDYSEEAIERLMQTPQFMYDGAVINFSIALKEQVGRTNGYALTDVQPGTLNISNDVIIGKNIYDGRSYTRIIAESDGKRIVLDKKQVIVPSLENGVTRLVWLEEEANDEDAETVRALVSKLDIVNIAYWALRSAEEA